MSGAITDCEGGAAAHLMREAGKGWGGGECGRSYARARAARVQRQGGLHGSDVVCRPHLARRQLEPRRSTARTAVTFGTR
eukprot:scaffold5173_cov125-Isochrysis_galbana.AAC.10